MKTLKIHLPWVTLTGHTDGPSWRCYGAMLVHEALELLPVIDAHANRWALRYSIGAPGPGPGVDDIRTPDQLTPRPLFDFVVAFHQLHPSLIDVFFRAAPDQANPDATSDFGP